MNIPLGRHQTTWINMEVSKERLLGRTVLDWSAVCGRHDSGSPEFLGFKLAELGCFGNEWLILRMCQASFWVSVNGCWLMAMPGQYTTQTRPLVSKLPGNSWDHFSEHVIGMPVQGFESARRSTVLRIAGMEISLTEDSAHRPPHQDGSPRTLEKDIDLRNAWVIAGSQDIRI